MFTVLINSSSHVKLSELDTYVLGFNINMNLTMIERQFLISKSSLRSFPGRSHFSSSRQAFLAARSPRVTHLEKQRKNEALQRLHSPDQNSPWPPTPQQSQNMAVKEWPTSVLRNAENSRYLPVSSRKAIKILNDFVAAVSAEELCSSKTFV